jgi:hypothetical protein
MTSPVVSAERQPLAARERREIARGLLEAALSGEPVAPPSDRFPALTVATRDGSATPRSHIGWPRASG